MSSSRIGVLALQGGFRPHLAALEAIGRQALEIRGARALESIDGLVLCGGESTAQTKLIEESQMREPLLEVVRTRPVLATCAGAILLARFGLLDVEIDRNAYGPQIFSFEATSERGLPLVFIRAPRIRSVAASVEVLDTFEGAPILVRQGNRTAATFHPELTGERRVFVDVFGVLS